MKRVDASIDGERMLVDVAFIVRETNRRDNIVFPFFEESVLD